MGGNKGACAKASPTRVAPPGSWEGRKAVDTGPGQGTLCGRSRGQGRGSTHGLNAETMGRRQSHLLAFDWKLSMRIGGRDAGGGGGGRGWGARGGVGILSNA